MPLGKGIRYRMVIKGGKKIRLAFRGKKVIEAKNMATGDTHTPAEFKKDEMMKKKRMLAMRKKMLAKNRA